MGLPAAEAPISGAARRERGELERRVGNVLVYDLIARGGMAVVHLGQLLTAEGPRAVAVKRVRDDLAEDEELCAMFRDEARLASFVRHPNVVSTVDVVSDSRQEYLILEYVQGVSLSTLWRESRRVRQALPLGVIVSIVHDMLNGLHAAHEARNRRGQKLGIVHRDVSPHNVLVGEDGSARIMDFGIAKAGACVHNTLRGAFKGKFGYMAPESLLGKTIDRRVDVFAAGVVLWELLTGRRLFDVRSADAAAAAIAHSTDDIEAPSDIDPSLPRTLDRVVLRALARNRNDRYQTAAQFAKELVRALPAAPAHEVASVVQQLAGPVLQRRAQALSLIAQRAAFDAAATGFEAPRSQPSQPPRHADLGTLLMGLVALALLCLLSLLLAVVWRAAAERPQPAEPERSVAHHDALHAPPPVGSVADTHRRSRCGNNTWS